MSHFAQLDENNVVLQVLVGDNNDPAGDEGYQWFVDNLGGRWVQTSYSGRIRKNYAGIGYFYDEARDAFIAPKPECHPDKVVFDEETCIWSCPDASHVIIIGEENV
jgi:hypothetical protein